MKNEANLRDNIKCTNICIVRVPGEKREKGIENVFNEIMAENFPNLKKETDMYTGSTEGPKQDEPEQTHTKTYHN